MLLTELGKTAWRAGQGVENPVLYALGLRHVSVTQVALGSAGGELEVGVQARGVSQSCGRDGHENTVLGQRGSGQVEAGARCVHWSRRGGRVDACGCSGLLCLSQEEENPLLTAPVFPVRSSVERSRGEREECWRAGKAGRGAGKSSWTWRQ